MVEHLYNCNCPNGETNKQVIDRIKRFIDMCFKEYNNRRILVITHGGIVMLALNYIFGESPSLENKRIHGNCFASYVEINDKLKVLDSLVNVHCKDIMIKNFIKNYSDELIS